MALKNQRAYILCPKWILLSMSYDYLALQPPWLYIKIQTFQMTKAQNKTFIFTTFFYMISESKVCFFFSQITNNSQKEIFLQNSDPADQPQDQSPARQEQISKYIYICKNSLRLQSELKKKTKQKLSVTTKTLLQTGAEDYTPTPQFQFSESDTQTRGSVFQPKTLPQPHTQNTLSRCFKYTKHAG